MCRGSMTRGFAIFVAVWANPLSAAPDAPASSATVAKDSALEISGVIEKKEEIWDRRSNPLMGRPDILKEIRLRVKILRLLQGDLPAQAGKIRVSIKGEKAIIRYKSLRIGAKGVFRLMAADTGHILISFSGDSGKPSEPTRPPSPPPPPHPYRDPDSGIVPDGIRGSDIIQSKELQEKTVRAVAKRFGMSDAYFLSLTSFSGPEPPQGGYKYWGVCGKIKGRWHVWQRGQGGKLREGTALEDPQRYNKCNSPHTLISVPGGAVPIRDLKPGDLVLSDGMAAVPILKVSKVKAVNHIVCRLAFDDGVILEISPSHPLPDGRRIGDLQVGDSADGRRILKAERIPYVHSHTYDILPDSRSGTYYANGIRVGSTLTTRVPGLHNKLARYGLKAEE